MFHKTDEVEVAVHKLLQMQEPYFYYNETHAKVRQMLSMCWGIMLKDNDTSA
jgi:hypothetical protein